MTDIIKKKKKKGRPLLWILTFLSIIIIITIPIVFITIPISKNIDVPLSFNKFNAYNHIVNQLALGYRIPGTQARIDCANYFVSEFQSIDPNFSYILHNFSVHGVACQNVLFKLNPHLNNIIILGAHYDSRAKATKDPLRPSDPVPGANDGASGSAVLIELARVFYSVRNSLESQIWFLFFDAEDQGYDVAPGIPGWDWCEGSWEFANNIDNFYNSATEYFEAMVLLDMVGGTGLKFIKEQNSVASLLEELFSTGRSLGYEDQFPINAETASVTDDHVPFLSLGIPSAVLIINFWNNPNWPYHHTTSDDIAHISKESLEVTGKTVEQFIFNNFMKDSDYIGNYPWDDHIPPTDFIIFIIGVAIIIGISVISIHYNRRKLWEKSKNEPL